MKMVGFVLRIVSLVGIVLFTQTTKIVEAQAVDLKSSARTFVETLAREDFATAVKSFGAPLNNSLPPEELRTSWKAVLAKRGGFQKILGIRIGRVEEYGGQKYDVVIVQCQLERAQMDVRISFSRARQITSLWFVPPEKNN